MLRCLIAILLIFSASIAVSQERRPSHCFAIAEAAPGLEYLRLANYTDPVEPFSARITYIDHSMFLIQSEGGLSAVTDYNGYIGATDLVPDVVTMNNAHSSHWTALPNDNIDHVLEGWAKPEGPEEHYLDLGEMLVRNVHTDTRSFDGGARINGNSIFVFELAGLCIGHLGHLHHIPDDAQFAALGRLDVVMAAVDGGLTLDTASIVQVVKRLRSSIVLPMHWFGRGSLEAFLDGMEGEFDIIRTMPSSSLEVSLRTLPSRPTVMVLPPRFLQLNDDE